MDQTSFSFSFYSFLSQLRPSILAHLLAKCLGVSRHRFISKNGECFLINPISNFGFSLLKEGVYEPAMSEAITALLRNHDTFIDAGANEGYFSVLAAHKAPHSRIELFEPQIRLNKIIHENLRLNNVTNATLHSTALSDQNEQTRLYLSNEMNTGASGFFSKRQWSKRIQKTQTQTLDSFLENSNIHRVRLIKIDCEGGEIKIIPGMSKALQENRFDFIILECHPTIIGEKSCQQLIDFIHQAGYHTSQLASGLWVHHLPSVADELLSLGPVKRIH